MAGVELRDAGPDALSITIDGRVAGAVRLSTDGGTSAACAVESSLGIGGAANLVEQLDALGVARIDSTHLLVRNEARKRGFGGALRAPLRKGDAPTHDIVELVGELVPAVNVELRAPRTAWGRFLANTTGGLNDMVTLVATPKDGGVPIRIAMPGRADVSEAVASAIDTMLAVHHRFGNAVSYVRLISFDHFSHDMVSGNAAGEAAAGRGAIHINASYTFTQGLESLETKRLERGPDYPSPAHVPAPWTAVDGTVAHELWHKIELAMEATRYRDTIEMRREIGSWFGVPTLEHVFEVPDARSVLARGVSLYAATRRLEATAEMFKLWWCGPAPAGTLAARFGELVDRYLPEARS